MKTSLMALVLICGTLLVDAQARPVAREEMAKSGGSGTNIGGGSTGSEYLATWCRNQLSLLKNYKARAALKLENTGDYNMANKILTDGIVEALKSGVNASESFFHKSLVRGLEISKHLGATQGGNPERKATTANYILNSYYDFILEYVGKNLDLNGQIPYLNASMAEQKMKSANFEKNFVTYAVTQLDWTLTNLTKEIQLAGKPVIIPVGEARSVIKVMITLATATQEDLENSLWSYRFSCAISDLDILNKTLKAYDQGNKEIFEGDESDKQALTYATTEIRRISNALPRNGSCQ